MAPTEPPPPHPHAARPPPLPALAPSSEAKRWAGSKADGGSRGIGGSSGGRHVGEQRGEDLGGPGGRAVGVGGSPRGRERRGAR